MGGAMAMYYGYQRGLQLAGIFAMSSFLNSNSKVYQVSTDTVTCKVKQVIYKFPCLQMKEVVFPIGLSVYHPTL